jgi:hypothetical protein
MRPPDSFGAAVAEQLDAAAAATPPSEGTAAGRRSGRGHTHRHVEDTEVDVDGSSVLNQVLAGIILLSIGAFAAHIYDEKVRKGK